jgi:hypothetical protein
MEAISSIIDNFKQRVKNPFFGTFIFVWVYRNWEAVYCFFNFDKEVKLYSRIDILKYYFKDKHWFCELPINVFLALCLLILWFCIVVITKVIITFTYDNLIPLLTSKVESNSIVARDKYQSVKLERDTYLKEIYDERERNVKAEKNNSDLKQELALEKENFSIKLKDLNDTEILLKEQKDKVTELSEQVDKLTSSLNDIEIKNLGLGKLLDKFKNDNYNYFLDKENVKINTNYVNHTITFTLEIEENIIELGEKLKEQNLLSEFFYIYNVINEAREKNEELISKNLMDEDWDNIKIFFNLGLLIMVDEIFKISDTGNKLFKYKNYFI